MGLIAYLEFPIVFTSSTRSDILAGNPSTFYYTHVHCKTADSINFIVFISVNNIPITCVYNQKHSGSKVFLEIQDDFAVSSPRIRDF